VGGISWESSEADILSYFSRYGEVVECALMTNKVRTIDNCDTACLLPAYLPALRHTTIETPKLTPASQWSGTPRGFAFVTFRDDASAGRVLQETHSLGGRLGGVKRAIPREGSRGRVAPSATRLDRRKIFVGGLAGSVTEVDVRAYFCRYGPLLDATVMIDRETNRCVVVVVTVLLLSASVHRATTTSQLSPTQHTQLPRVWVRHVCRAGERGRGAVRPGAPAAWQGGGGEAGAAARGPPP